MQLGMIGLGRMGANMVRRLMRGGQECVVFDVSANAVEELAQEQAVGATDFRDFLRKLKAPRAIWLMVPAAAVDQTIGELIPYLEAGDTLIDGEIPITSMTFAVRRISRQRVFTVSTWEPAEEFGGWTEATA